MKSTSNPIIGPSVTISRTGVVINIPVSFWTDPHYDKVVVDGKTLRQHAIQALGRDVVRGLMKFTTESV